MMRIERLEPGLVAPETGALRTKTFRWLMGDVLRPPAGARVADLGAGPCVFSKIARDLGLDVTAVDVRDARLPRDLGTITFVKSDIRAFDPSGYDIILILGLLYHLTVPDQISLLMRCPASSTLIIDTQVHIPELVVQESNRDGFGDRLVTQGPYTGVLYPEADNAMASWGNELSFWHTVPSLLTLLENSGRNWIRIVDPPYVSKYGARHWLIAAVQ